MRRILKNSPRNLKNIYYAVVVCGAIIFTSQLAVRPNVGVSLFKIETPKNVAILLFSADRNAKLEAFLSSARLAFEGSFKNVKTATRFIYFLPNEVKAIDNKTIFLAVNEHFENSCNPCGFYFSHGNALYKDSNKYDYVLFFDYSSEILGNVDIGSYLLEPLVTTLHEKLPFARELPSFLKQEGLDLPPLPKRRLHYTSSIFGGTTENVLAMCRQLKSVKDSDFHKRFNEYFHDNEPSLTILLHELPADQKDMHFGESTAVLNMQSLFMTKGNTRSDDYLKDLEAMEEHEITLIYQLASQKIAELIKGNYAMKVFHPILTRGSDGVKVITSYCPYNFTICGGFGDRLRGAVTSLYLAIATRRVLRMGQTKPVDLEEYFDINEKYYDISRSDFLARVDDNSQNDTILSFHNLGVQMNKRFESKGFQQLLKGVHDIKLQANRYAGLQPMFKRKSFSSVVENTLNIKIHPPISYPIFISGALQFLVGELSPRLHSLLEYAIHSTAGNTKWKNSVKIGIQMRFEEYANFSLDRTPRLEKQHITCFAEEAYITVINKIRRIPSFGASQSQVIIFVTTDWAPSFEIFTKEITRMFNRSLQENNVTLMATGKSQNLTITHIDQSNARYKMLKDQNEAWMLSAKTYLDWHILTKMDYLLITRSGFGETASMASLAVTKRLFSWNRYISCGFSSYNVNMRNVDERKEIVTLTL